MPENRKPMRRVLLKLSGEALGKVGAGSGIDIHELRLIASEIKSALETGANIAVVVGGGNMIRGAELAREGLVHQASADHMGMLGTVMNGIALKEALESVDVPARCLTAIDIPAVAEPFIRGRAMRHMEKGRVVILVAGTGNPFFTTDSCAALRAIELECEAVLKATKVDGVYDADPRTNPQAERYTTLTFAEAIEKQLRVMDLTALAMCQEHKVPVIVFDYKVSGNIRRVIEGNPIGTLIHCA